jgi:hypothetical protein
LHIPSPTTCFSLDINRLDSHKGDTSAVSSLEK